MPEVEGRPFGVQFKEAISYLKGKLPEASVAWDDLAGPVHGKVYTVAGATTADLARDLQASLVDALASGKTITAFRKDFDRITQEHGWTYRGKRGWRTSVIFDNNMRSAHMAGRWQQLQANKDRRPYLQYRTAGDARVRPEHRQWNGLIFHIDDPFWQTHYPPCGWGCRCTVRSLSQAELDARGLQVSPPFEMMTRLVVSRDGEIKDEVPVGIDPGWDHNVGEAWITPELSLGHKLARLPRELQGLVVDKTITPAFQKVLGERWKGFRTALNGAAPAATDSQVLGFLDSATLAGLAEAVPELQVVSTTVAGFSNQLPMLTPAASPAWPTNWIDELPTNLRNYQAVLFDTVSQRLVVVPQGTLPASGGRLATIVLQPNVATGFGAAFAAESLGSASPAELANTARYTLLVGKVR